MSHHHKELCTTAPKHWRAFGTVFENGGKMMSGLANRSGHCNHAEGRNNKGWGGVRMENLLQLEIEQWLHFHAQEAKAEQTKELIK